jgi:peptidoglycan/xylan/chitin deacetylase (PgdA/CDA1 family)
MAFLKRLRYRVLDLDHALACLRGERPTPPRALVLTFDDAYAGFVDHALPVLQHHGFSATVYAITGWLGRKAEWFAKDPGRPIPDLMSAAQLREMRSLGLTIGSHTVNHPMLAELSPEQQRSELADSKAALEDLLGEEIRHLCYPSGSFDLSTVRIAAATGFLTATTCLRGNAEPVDHPLALPRKAISFGDDLVGFFWKLSVKKKPKPRLVEWRRLLVDESR